MEKYSLLRHPDMSVKSSFALLLIIFFSCFINQSMAIENEGNDESGDYRLGVGDKFKIQVYNEPDLNLETWVEEKGQISYPFLGTIKVLGLTPQGLEKLITERLKGDYLIDPKVSVYITEYRKYFVNGEVKAPGGYSYQPGITVHRAISLAGGFSERASRDKIFIVHENNIEAKPVKVGLDAKVLPGDILTVEESFF